MNDSKEDNPQASEKVQLNVPREDMSKDEEQKSSEEQAAQTSESDQSSEEQKEDTPQSPADDYRKNLQSSRNAQR